MEFALPRSPSVALREYVPGNLIYANGNRFVARRFHRDVDEQRIETKSPPIRMLSFVLPFKLSGPSETPLVLRSNRGQRDTSRIIRSAAAVPV